MHHFLVFWYLHFDPDTGGATVEVLQKPLFAITTMENHWNFLQWLRINSPWCPMVLCERIGKMRALISPTIDVMWQANWKQLWVELRFNFHCPLRWKGLADPERKLKLPNLESDWNLKETTKIFQGCSLIWIFFKKRNQPKATMANHCFATIIRVCPYI